LQFRLKWAFQLWRSHPPHDLFATVDFVCWLCPPWPSLSIENMAARLKIANEAAHRALGDARLVKEIFLAVLQDAPPIRAITDLRRLSPPLTFADAPVCAIEPSPGFEALAMAIAERYIMMVVYAGGTQPSRPCIVTP
jgi:DNA polymerase III epsilon subunit-like protein